MGNNDVADRIKKKAYELRHKRREGFDDTHLDSKCIINEIKFLFDMLSKSDKNNILNKPWLDE